MPSLKKIEWSTQSDAADPMFGAFCDLYSAVLQPRIAFQRRGMSLRYGNRRLRRQSCGDPLA
jgi:hypothetical protein